MNYCLYKLRFTTLLHAGSGESAKSLDSSCTTLCADTLFSALCHTALTSGGAPAVEKLCRMVDDGALSLTDTMPYCGEALYIPKPYIKAQKAAADEPSAEDRKAMKKLAYIPVSSLGEFFSSLRGTGRYDAKAHKTSFGESYITTKNSIERIDETKNATPYFVGLFEFAEGCGLYFIAALENEDDTDFITMLVERLGLGGIGGKTSSGYGKFMMADDPKIIINGDGATGDEKILIQMLEREEAPLYISLTTSLPRDEELDAALDGASYGVSRRGGFVFSESFTDRPVKKRTQYFLSAGSVFAHKFSGGLYSVAEDGAHPVFRYGAPVFLGADRP